MNGRLPQPLDQPLVARVPGCSVPLTALQLGMWNGLKKGAASDARLAVTCVRIQGPLDTFLLRQCLDALVERHEPLRTRIVPVDDIPTQQIDTACECRLETMDLTTLPPKDAEAEARQLVQELIEAQTDLATGPLFEGRLLKLSAADHVLAFAIDHIIADGTSCEILNRELWTLYDQATQGQPLSLPQLPLQFADYAVWQQQTHGAWIEHHGAYWRERLGDAPSSIKIPRDDGLQNANSSVATSHFPLGKAVTAQLRAIAAAERTRLSSLVLAMYVAAMSRWLEQRDLVLSFVSHGRQVHPELKNMVGFLANHMILRIGVEEQDSFVSLLGRVDRELRSAYRHFDFGRVLHLYPQCISQIVFNWIPADWMGTSAQHKRTRESPLTLWPFQVLTSWPVHFYPFFTETSFGITITVAYRTDMFAKATVDRFGNDLRQLAAACARDPLTAIASVVLAST